MTKTVSSFAELVEALHHDPHQIDIEGLIPIPDSRLGASTWEADPRGKPFSIDNPLSYNPLANNRTTLRIPHGSGFIAGRNNTDPRKEGHLFLRCDIQAGAYPIFFCYRSGHIAAQSRDIQRVTVTAIRKGILTLKEPLNPIIPGHYYLAEKMAIYFEGDPFGGRLEAGSYYYGGGSGNQLTLYRDPDGHIPVAPHLPNWAGEAQLWVCRASPSFVVKPANSAAPAFAAWWGVIDFATIKGGLATVRMEAVADGAGGYKLEAITERCVADTIQAIFDSYDVGASDPSHLCGHVLAFGRQPMSIMRPLIIESHYGMQIEGPKRGGVTINGNFGGKYAPAYGETENSLHFHEISKHARGMICARGIVYDQIINTFTLNVWDGGLSGGSGDCPTDFALLHLPECGSAENFSGRNMHLRRMPYVGIRLGMHQNIMTLSDIVTGNAGSESCAIEITGEGGYPYGGTNLTIKRISTVNSKLKHGVRFLGRAFGTVVFETHHAEGPQAALFVDSMGYENRSNPPPLMLCVRDINLHSNQEAGVSKIRVLNAHDRTLVHYDAVFTDADLIAGKPGQIRIPAHPFATGDTVYRSSDQRLPVGLESIDAYVHCKKIDANTIELHYSSRYNRPIPLKGQSPGGTHYLLKDTRVLHDSLLAQISGLSAAGIADGPYQIWKPDRWTSVVSLGCARPNEDGSRGPWEMWPELKQKLADNNIKAGTNELQTFENVFPYTGANTSAYIYGWEEIGLKSGYVVVKSWGTSGIVELVDPRGGAIVLRKPSEDWSGYIQTRNFVPLPVIAGQVVGSVFGLVGAVHVNGWPSLNLEAVQVGDMSHVNNYAYFDGQLQAQSPEDGYVRFRGIQRAFSLKSTFKHGLKASGNTGGYIRAYEAQGGDQTIEAERYAN